jgi:hypothetical protein
VPKTTTACNPWLGRKLNRDMLEKLTDVFMDTWGDDGKYGDAAAKFDEELLDFFFSCLVDQVDNDDEDTITVRFRVPPPVHVLDV